MNQASTSTRAATAAIALSLALLTAAPAQAATVPVNARVLAHQVRASGNVSVLAGQVEDPALGRGAAIYRVRYPERVFTFVQFNDRGKIRGRGRVDAAPGPNGGVLLTGTARVMGGSGAYRGARGRLTISGTSDATFNDDLRLTGSVRVPVR